MKRKLIISKTVILAFAFSFLFCVTIIAQSQSTVRPKIANIVSKLKKESTMHLGYAVGFSGVPETNNKYYKLYQKLSLQATNEELVILTNDNSKTVILYSFVILNRRNYSGLKDIFLEHLNDTTDVWIAGGCTGVIDKVNSFMLGQLNPIYTTSDKAYLTKNEYDDYLNLFRRADNR